MDYNLIYMYINLGLITMIWYYILVGRKQKRPKMAFPYDEANNVYGLMERKTNKKSKLKDEFWEKHNEYNEKKHHEMCEISMFLLLFCISFVVFNF